MHSLKTLMVSLLVFSFTVSSSAGQNFDQSLVCKSRETNRAYIIRYDLPVVNTVLHILTPIKTDKGFIFPQRLESKAKINLVDGFKLVHNAVFEAKIGREGTKSNEITKISIQRTGYTTGDNGTHPLLGDRVNNLSATIEGGESGHLACKDTISYRTTLAKCVIGNAVYGGLQFQFEINYEKWTSSGTVSISENIPTSRGTIPAANYVLMGADSAAVYETSPFNTHDLKFYIEGTTTGLDIDDIKYSHHSSATVLNTLLLNRQLKAGKNEIYGKSIHISTKTILEDFLNCEE